MARTVRQRNMRGHGALLRAEILDAATRAIDQADHEGEVSLRSIAREAGIAAPSVYAHFADRDDVLEAVAESSWAQVNTEIAELVDAGETARDRLIQGCRAYVAFARRHPLRYALMTRVTDAPPAALQALDVVTRGLRACRGDAPAPKKESDKIAAALSVALHGVAMLHRTDVPHLWLSNFSTDDIIASLVDAAILQQDQIRPTRRK